MFKTVAEYDAAIRAELGKAKVIADAVKALSRDLDDNERTTVSEHLNQVEKLDNEKKALVATLEGRAYGDKIEALLGGAAAAQELNEKALDGADKPGTYEAPKSWGKAFISTEMYKSFLKDYPSGPPESMSIKSAPVNMGGFKDLITHGDLPGIINPDQRGLIIPPVWGRELSIRDIITIGQTTSDVIEYAQLQSVTNAAAPVAEAANFNDGAISVTDTAGGAPYTVTVAAASGAKPFSNMVYEKVTTVVKTIAHLMGATRRALSDAGQLATLIDSFLRYGLQEEVEDQIVSGDASGENFDGIYHVTGTQDQPFSVDPLQTIRKAITKARVTGRVRPNAVGLHPADDEMLDLLQDDLGRYLGQGPWSSGPNTVWGLPRYVSEAIVEGTAVVADWKQAVLWDREQTTVAITEAHKDWFARNLVALRAELRAAFGILRPAGFVIADLTSS
jgi:HK97 family phage major capsid protein